MNKPIRILVSGPGLIGKKHLQLISERRDCNLEAIVAPSSAENLLVANQYKAPLYSTIESAISQKSIDAAIISSPNAFHFEQAITCLKHGIPALIEKPLTDKIDHSLTLTEESERRGVPLLVGHHRTYSPLLTTASKFLKSPQFGKLVAIQGSALFYKPAKYFEDGAWRTRKGGGPILINMIHEIGLMRHLFGEFRSVYAAASHNIRNFEVEDTVAMTFEFKNGALGSFILSDSAASSKSWEMTSGENHSYPHFPQQDCYHFAGTNGSLDFPSMNFRYYENKTAPSWWSSFEEGCLAFSPQDPLFVQLDHFLQVVRGNTVPLVSARDGYMNMLIVEAIAKSIDSRMVVALSPP